MSGWPNAERVRPGAALRATDPEIARLIDEETTRQNDGLELIASPSAMRSSRHGGP